MPAIGGNVLTRVVVGIIVIAVFASVVLAVDTSRPWHGLDQVGTRSTDANPVGVDTQFPLGELDRATFAPLVDFATNVNTANSATRATSCGIANNANLVDGLSATQFCWSDGSQCPSAAPKPCSCSTTTVDDLNFAPYFGFQAIALAGAMDPCPSGYAISQMGRGFKTSWNSLNYKCTHIVTTCTC